MNDFAEGDLRRGLREMVADAPPVEATRSGVIAAARRRRSRQVGTGTGKLFSFGFFDGRLLVRGDNLDLEVRRCSKRFFPKIC